MQLSGWRHWSVFFFSKFYFYISFVVILLHSMHSIREKNRIVSDLNIVFTWKMLPFFLNFNVFFNVAVFSFYIVMRFGDEILLVLLFRFVLDILVLLFVVWMQKRPKMENALRFSWCWRLKKKLFIKGFLNNSHTKKTQTKRNEFRNGKLRGRQRKSLL